MQAPTAAPRKTAHRSWKNPDRAQRRYILSPELLELVPKSAITLWRWEKKGLFPKRLRLGPHSVCWDRQEVLEWLESRPRGPASSELTVDAASAPG